jgi:hypothetical protein
MEKLLVILLLTTMPVIVTAQKEDFLREYRQVNEAFAAQGRVSLVQKYFLYNGDTTDGAADSSSCTIAKNNNSIRYLFNNMEYFSDSGYAIEISHDQQLLFISKSPKTDIPVINQALSEGFENYSIFKKHTTKNHKSCWEISGGTKGIISMTIVMDTEMYRIELLTIHFSANHPFISQFRRSDQAGHNVTLKIEYDYATHTGNGEFTKLSDYVTFSNAGVQPNMKFQNYKIQRLN